MPPPKKGSFFFGGGYFVFSYIFKIKGSYFVREIDIELLNNKKLTRTLIRIFDILLSIIGIICLLPIFLLTALFIKIESPKYPVIFKQERIGENGQKFIMYKFRSMVVDAEDRLESLLELNEVEGAIFKIKEDPRVTKVGKIIRKTSIDELPQLLNVLKGEMSLVGPRPPLPREVAQYTDYDKQRLLIKPGCTGLWQINGRSHVHFEDMVALDLEYIDNLSIKNYFKVIFKTIFMILNLEGAY